MSASAPELGGRVALVTGASRGIGAAIARALAAAGARVAVHYAQAEERARSVAAEIAAAGHPEPLVVRADLTMEEERRRLVEEVRRGAGEPLLLVNNAGIFERNPFTNDDAEFL